MHPPPGLPGLEPLDIALCIRVFCEPFDMFADNPPVFLGPLPDERLYLVFDLYSHGLPRSEAEIFFGLVPGNVVGVLIDRVKIAFEHPGLMLRYEICNSLPECLPRLFQP